MDVNDSDPQPKLTANEYFRTKQWRILKNFVSARCNDICERCHNAPYQETHHLTYVNWQHESPDELQGVCSACHREIHGVVEDKSLCDPEIGGPLVRGTDPDTSQKAAAKIKPRRPTIQRDVLQWFIAHKEGTDEEIENDLRWKYRAQTTVSKRRTELMYMGWVQDSEKRKIGSNGSPMIIWELVPSPRTPVTESAKEREVMRIARRLKKKLAKLVDLQTHDERIRWEQRINGELEDSKLEAMEDQEIAS
jgi:hypothetical protein